LAGLGASEDDLALTQGAAGDEILFAEACVRLGVRIQLLQPFPEVEFIQRSILPFAQGERWQARYLALKSHLKNPPRNMADALGNFPEEEINPNERCNRWLLYTALACGIDKVHFICIDDRGDADELGYKVQMYQQVNKRL
jgi:hypothetical protein